MKERLFLEDHTGQHAAETPHVQTVIIHLFTQYNTHLTINNLKRKQQCDIQKLLLNISLIIKVTNYMQWLSIGLTSDMLRVSEWCSKYHHCLFHANLTVNDSFLLLSFMWQQCQEDFWSEDKTIMSKTFNINNIVEQLLNRSRWRCIYIFWGT